MKDQSVYLRDILERIERIQAYTADGQIAFNESTLLQDAVMRNFQVIGEAAKRLAPEFREQHSEIDWRLLTGFRDVIVHNYNELVLSQIWKATQELSPFYVQIRQLLDHLNNDE